MFKKAAVWGGEESLARAITFSIHSFRVILMSLKSVSERDMGALNESSNLSIFQKSFKSFSAPVQSVNIYKIIKL